jgi:hypothetical protein
MKKTLLLTSLLFWCALAAQAQLDPVKWTYTAKKIADKTYEIHLTATIRPSWHLYSQTQPDDAINMPTEILFSKNPLLIFDGKVKELGKLQVFKDARLKLSAHQYSGSVDFVQVVKLKSGVKTAVIGSVEYQTCDDKKCLPPKKVDFTVAIK